MLQNIRLFPPIYLAYILRTDSLASRFRLPGMITYNHSAIMWIVCLLASLHSVLFAHLGLVLRILVLSPSTMRMAWSIDFSAIPLSLDGLVFQIIVLSRKLCVQSFVALWLHRFTQ